MRYCGIVFIAGGSSWAWAVTPEEAAIKAAKCCRKDWGRMYKIPKGELDVNIYDMKYHDGWDATGEGVFSTTTNEKLEPIQIIKEA